MDQAAFTRPFSEQVMLPPVSSGAGTALAQAVLRSRALQPFAWQNEDQLLLLDCDEGGWRVAELRFLIEQCVYVEVRNVSYQSQREAIGALLSRALSRGGDALIDTVEQLDAYMTRHYQVGLINA